MGETMTADASEILLQSVAELARGLALLEAELNAWAKINTAHGRATIAGTLADLGALIMLQDVVVPKVIAEKASQHHAR